MKAYRLDNSAPKPTLVEADIPQPALKDGEVLIKVYAAGVTTTELTWEPTTHTPSGGDRIGAVPGHEFSGIITALGPQSDSFQVGQSVFGMNDWYADGATAEYCAAPISALTLKPDVLSHAEAASIPISALTAWQGLVDRAKVQPGEQVLVHGASGAVGAFAVQIAKLRGARITATASAANAEFVKQLGAERVIDYKTSRFENEIENMDVVFDTVGGDTLERSWQVLKPGGRMVTIVSDVPKDKRAKNAFFIVEPKGDQLASLSAMIQDGRLRSVVDAVVPWAQVPQAYGGTLKRSHRGKVVIAVDDSAR